MRLFLALCIFIDIICAQQYFQETYFIFTISSPSEYANYSGVYLRTTKTDGNGVPTDCGHYLGYPGPIHVYSGTYIYVKLHSIYSLTFNTISCKIYSGIS